MISVIITKTINMHEVALHPCMCVYIYIYREREGDMR